MNNFPWVHITKKLNGNRKKFNVEEVYDMFTNLILNIQVSKAY